jgi:hypothetical protein
MADKRDEIDATKRLIGALVRMKPKPHDEMKLSKLPKKRSSDLKRNVPKNPDKGKGNGPKTGG